MTLCSDSLKRKKLHIIKNCGNLKKLGQKNILFCSIFVYQTVRVRYCTSIYQKFQHQLKVVKLLI